MSGPTELDETPAEEFSRLIIEFNEGERQNRNEAWNLIADFACEHSDAIIRALSQPQATAPAGEGMVTEAPVVGDRKRIDDALVSCAGLLRTLCHDEIGDTAAAELEYVRSCIIPAAAPAPGVVWQATEATDAMWEAARGRNSFAASYRAMIAAAPASPQPANLAQVTDAIVEDALNSAIPEPWEVAEHATQRILAAIGAGGLAVAVKPLIWEEDHGIAGMGPYRLFKAETPLGRFVYGTDSEGSAYYHTASSGVMMVGNEATAKRLAEAAWGKVALAEVGKFVDPSTLSQPHPADERVVEALRGIRDSIAKGFTENGLEHHRIRLTDGTWLEGRAATDWRNMLVAFRDIATSALSVAPATADGWRDMSEAPKDGTWVIAYRPSKGSGYLDRVVIVRWDDEVSAWAWPDQPFDVYDDDYAERLAAQGLGDHIDPFEDNAFTHWMPLPAAPTATGGR